MGSLLDCRLPEQRTPAVGYPWDRDTYYRRTHLRLRIIAGLLQRHEPARARLLDVGCGPALLARLLGVKEGYVGLDAFPPVLTQPRDFDVRPWRWLDGAATPLGEPMSFDLVVASGFLEYIDDRRGFLGAVHDVLRPDGIALISIVNARSWPRRWRHWRRHPRASHPCWRALASPTELAALGATVGLEAITCTPVVAWFREWPGAGYSLRRRRLWASSAKVLTHPFADQWILELRRKRVETR